MNKIGINKVGESKGNYRHSNADTDISIHVTVCMSMNSINNSCLSWEIFGQVGEGDILTIVV